MGPHDELDTHSINPCAGIPRSCGVLALSMVGVMNAQQRLTEALIEAGAPAHMVDAAKKGYYGDFSSPLATPITQLVNDCYAYNLIALGKRAMHGEFDGR
jgi:hypothetical protein